jgi:hypothetical protein
VLLAAFFLRAAMAGSYRLEGAPDRTSGGFLLRVIDREGVDRQSS